MVADSANHLLQPRPCNPLPLVPHQILVSKMTKSDMELRRLLREVESIMERIEEGDIEEKELLKEYNRIISHIEFIKGEK